MRKIEIEIKNKIARSPEAEIVCGNSDYEIHFSFDEEWSEYNVKTARFKYNGKKEDIVFEGNVCNAPIIKGASFCTVGVYAGDLHTTTPALIACKKSILCDDGVPADPTPDVYAQLMEKLNKITGLDDEVVARALAAYLAENPLEELDPTVPEWAKQENKPSYTAQEVGALSAESLPAAVNEALAQAKASGAFDGRTPVKGEDYFTEADKQEIAEQAAQLVDVPEELPNPNALTFTGAVEGSYDGSQPLSIAIPQGGGGSEMRLIHIEDIPKGDSFVECIVTTDDDGKPFSINRLIVEFSHLTSQYANKVFVNDVEVTPVTKSGTNATYTAYIEYLGDAYFHIRTIQTATNVSTIWEYNALRDCDMPITKIAVTFIYPSWQEGAKMKIFGG